MGKVSLRKALAPASIVTAGLLLAGCGSATTYGTGKSPGAQTLEDIGGIVSMGGKSHAVAIDYKQRPGVVEPPSTAVLPPPKSKQEGDQQLAMSGDWPKDPDEEAAKMDAAVKEAAASGQDLKFTVPGATRTYPNHGKEYKSHSVKLRKEKLDASLNVEEQKKLFADAKRAKSGSVDENGNPVRLYLTEPPSDYRTPDPNAPLEITEKKKNTGFKLPDLWPF